MGELTDMLDRLRRSPALRQEASTVLLAMARTLSVAEVARDYEGALCSFLKANSHQA